MPVVSQPAPVGGWNARDDLGNMPTEDAVILQNMRPRPGYVETRGGTGSSVASGTLFDNYGTAATFRSTFGDVLIFTSGDDLVAWTGSGSESTVYTGPSSSGNPTYWDSAHFQDRLIMTIGNGTNLAQVITYDGVTVTATDLNITTGPDEEDIRGVQVHKGRAYYWETASQSFWYAAAGAYQGDLTEFDLGTALKSGGALQMMVTLTVDGGGGKDDLACFIFSSGEVLVYQGDDPGDAAAWELVGSFEIGQPVDPQAHARIAGTELIYTRDGVIDLAAALQLGRFGETAEFTNKITLAATEAARDYVSNSGWQIVHAPADNCLVLNIPTSSTGRKQYIRETDTGAWWECTRWHGSFTVFEDRLYIVGQATDAQASIPGAYKCFEGTEDNINSTTTILANALPAFSTMRSPAQRKVLTAVKPFTDYGTPTGLKVTGRADFNTTQPVAPSDASGSSASRTQPNKSTFANGHYLSYYLQIRETGQKVKWNSTTIFYEEGGPV